jgi:hypothetical protein
VGRWGNKVGSGVGFLQLVNRLAGVVGEGSGRFDEGDVVLVGSFQIDGSEGVCAAGGGVTRCSSIAEVCVCLSLSLGRGF